MERGEYLTLTADNNKATRSLIYDYFLRAQLPTLQESFDYVNSEYSDYDKQAMLAWADGHPFTVKTRRHGPDIKARVLYDSDSAKAKQCLVVVAPFSDVDPRSSAEELYDLIQNPDPGFFDINLARPHSWNQATKSATIHDLLKAEGYAMPVVTIFAPLPMTAFSPKGMRDYSKGDFSRSSQITTAALSRVQNILHGPRSETQLDTVHFYGASIGASHAIASAAELSTGDETQVGSVTAQELILGPKHILDLLRRFTLGASVGEPSDEKVSVHMPKIEEVLMRRDIDRHGNELAAYLQMLNGMTKLTYLNGLTNPGPIIDNVRTIVINGIPITVATAENSGLTYQTRGCLHGVLGSNDFIRIRGRNGEKADHLIDENIVVSSTIALAGLIKAFR